MIALSGRDGVDLPLLCGVAGPEEPSVPLSLRWRFFPPSHGDNSVKNQHLSVIVPFCLPSWVPCSLRLQLCYPACVVNAPGPSVQASRCSDPSSLRAPTGERSHPVSADGVLQVTCHLFTVFLQSKKDAIKIYFEEQTNMKQ